MNVLFSVKMGFGLKLKTYREGKKMSQTELADAIGVSRNTIGNWEKEESQPNVFQVLTLSKILGVKMYDIVSELRDIMDSYISDIDTFNEAPVKYESHKNENKVDTLIKELQSCIEEKRKLKDQVKLQTDTIMMLSRSIEQLSGRGN